MNKQAILDQWQPLKEQLEGLGMKVTLTIDEDQAVPPAAGALYSTWTKAEQAFEDFMGAHDEATVKAMTHVQFLDWILEYRRLYEAVWMAQMCYYAALLEGRS